MKKIMMIAAMMVATLTASAQFEPGTFTLQPKVGVGFSEIVDDNAKFKFGIGAGFEGQYQINNWFGVAAGVMYQQKGSGIDNFDDVKINLEYIDVPIMAKFYVTKGLSLNVGLQPSFMTKAKIDNDGTDVDVKDNCEKFEFSVPMSIAYELPQGLTFEARYVYGLTDVGKNYFEKGSSTYDHAIKDKNCMFQITVGYKFAL